MKEVCGADSHLFTCYSVEFTLLLAVTMCSSIAAEFFQLFHLHLCVASQAAADFTAVAILDSYLETVIRARLDFI